MSSRSSDHEKLHTNAGLTKEAEAEVRRAMGRTLKKLDAVEIESARLQDRLVVLGQRKRDTAKFIEVHEGLLSPIRRVVPEILQEIFWLCLPVAHNSVLSAKEAPLVLGRVCSQWRRIAYSTPKLWCSLHITVPPLTYPCATAIFEASEAWITRSGILPLSISISDAKQMEVSKDQFRPYFDLITKHARRWRNIHIQVPIRDTIDFLVETDGDRFSLLEGFHFDRTFLGVVDHPLSRKDGILSAPLLRVLSLNKAFVQLLDLPVQWSLLTGLKIDLSYSKSHKVFELLTLCSNLETCAVDFNTSRHSFAISHSPSSRPNIILTKLRTLEISGRVLQSHTSLILLDNLATPALRHLAYHLYGRRSLPSTDISLSLKVFRSFSQRLNQPLEELEFHVNRSTTTYLMELFSLFPGLKRLSLLYPSTSSHSPCNDGLLLGFIPSVHISHHQSCSFEEDQVNDYELNSPSSSTCLCPNLEVLNIENASFSKRVLLEYLRSRLVDYAKDNVARLRRFTISFKTSVKDHDMMEEIDNLAKESGLLLKLGHKPSPKSRQRRFLPSMVFGRYLEFDR